MKKRVKKLACLTLTLVLLLALLPVLSQEIGAADVPPDSLKGQLGPIVTEIANGGNRDFIWPLAGNHNIKCCFYENDRYHYAIDISASSGTAVRASYAGTVHSTGYDSSMGNYVVLQHQYQLRTGNTITLYSRYKHLSEIVKSKGATVQAGDTIGKVGSTGNSTGPHLDFQILYGGINPQSQYSIDIYGNNLMEPLADDFVLTDSWTCGQKYVENIRRVYSQPLTPIVTGSDLVAYARNYLGVPYVSGGRTASGFDCCGFVWYVCNHFGIDVGSGNQTSQINYGTPVAYSTSSYSEAIANMQPGDLIFFNYLTGYTNQKEDHVGIYAGDGVIIHAASGGVKETPLNQSGWPSASDSYRLYQHICGIRRVVGTATQITFSTVDTGNYCLRNGSSYLTANTTLDSSTRLGVTAANGANTQVFNVYGNSSYSKGYLLKPLSNTNGRLNVWTSGTSANGNSVTLYRHTGNASQTWAFEQKGDAYLIHPYDNTSLSLTNTNGSTYVKTTTGDSSQLWYLENTSASAQSEPTVAEYNGHTYFYFSDAFSWAQANDFCEKLGGHLAVITDDGENELVKSLLSGRAWIGCTRTSDAGAWGWVTDETFGYANWSTEIGSEKYAEMQISGEWNDRVGSTAEGFVCEFDQIFSPVSSTKDGNTYYQLFDVSIPWMAAKAVCEMKGGHLVTIGSSDEQNIVKALIQNGSKNFYSIGFTDEETEGTWKWVTGEAASYENWDKSLPEPNGGTEENYAVIMAIDAPPNKVIGEWVDNANNHAGFTESVYALPNSGFVCEIQSHFYTITYDANGGTGAPSPQTKTHGQSLTLSSTIPTREGYIFEGWAESSSASGAQYQPGDSFTKNADTTLYALWIRESVIVASGSCGENIWWSLTDTGHMTIGGNGAMEDYADKKYAPWASVRQQIQSINIGNGVTHIGTHAFAYCEYLSSVSIPTSVTSIGTWAFYHCDSLLSVTIPAGVTSIGNEAFAASDNMTTIIVNANNPTYSSSNGILFSKDGKTLVQYPGGISGNVTIPSGVTTIGPFALCSCHKLTGVTIPSGVTTICNDAFSSCWELTSVTIPSTVTSIGDAAFYGCKKLSSVSIPNAVTSIGERAFYHCDSLLSVTIPVSVTSIGNEAFAASDNMTTIIVNANNPTYSSSNGILFSKDGKTLVQYPGGISGNVTIPSGVTAIGPFALCSCHKLTGVTIPSGVTTICNDAFSSCWELTSVTIPSTVTSIGDAAFYGCSKLSSVSIPNAVTSIGERAFMYCEKLASISIPDGVTDIKRQTFSNCTDLRSIGIPGSVTNIGPYAFNSCSSLNEVIFNGTKAQWNAIAVSSGNTLLLNAGLTCKKFSVLYDANGGSGAPAAQTKAYSQTLTLRSTKPTRTGYNFLGWAESSNATAAQYQAGGSFTKDADTTLYAVWQIKTYAVTYDANGGSGAPGAQTKTYGKTLTLSSTVPVREGYTFLGWAESGDAAAAQYQPGGSFTKNAVTTLYAVWKSDVSADAPRLTVENVSARPGQEISVPVTLTKNPGIAYLNFRVSYDTTRLTLTGYTDGTLKSWTGDISGGGFGWDDTANSTAAGTVLTLQFKVRDDAPEGKAQISLNTVTAYDLDENTVAVAAVSGAVTVSSRTPGDVTGDGEVDGRDLIRLRKHLIGMSVEADMNAADVTGDGEVDGRDLLRLRKHLIGMDVQLMNADVAQTAAKTGTLTLELPKEMPGPGENFAVPIAVACDGIAYLSFRVAYDKSRFALTGYDEGDLTGWTADVGGSDGFGWDDIKDTAPDGIVLTLNFLVLDSAADGAGEICAEMVSAYDFKEESVSLTAKPVSVEVCSVGILGFRVADGKAQLRTRLHGLQPDAVKLMIAAYDAAGRFLGASFAAPTAADSENLFEASVPVSGFAGATTYRAFLFKANGWSPLTPSAEFRP